MGQPAASCGSDLKSLHEDLLVNKNWILAVNILVFFFNTHAQSLHQPFQVRFGITRLEDKAGCRGLEAPKAEALSLEDSGSSAQARPLLSSPLLVSLFLNFLVHFDSGFLLRMVSALAGNGIAIPFSP